ncbi:hypothetical protein ACOMHN_039528 [Nucella lapillus]
MPVSPLVFRSACGGFVATFINFMLKRAKFKAAMLNQRVLKVRTKLHGVMVGVLLTLHYMGNLLHQCGDVELNLGPQKRISSQSSQKSMSTDQPASETTTQEPALKDLMSMMSDLSSKFDDMRKDINDLKKSYADLKEDVSDIGSAVRDLMKENRSLREENDVLKKKVED